MLRAAAGARHSAAAAAAAAIIGSRSRTFASSSVARAASVDLSYPTHARPTPHEIFHLPRNASQDEIKERYYELVRLHHPDSPACRHEPDQVRQERFKAITKAYETLKTNRNPAYVEEIHRQHAQRHGYVYNYPTRRQQYAYHSPYERSMNVGNGDVFVVITILAIIGSIALLYSPMTAKDRADRHHLTASQALAQARREGKELGIYRREQIRKWTHESGLEGVDPKVGHGPSPSPPPRIEPPHT